MAFLGIDVRDNDIEAPRDFVIDRDVTYPSIYDPAMRTMIAFGGKYPTTVIPSTVVLDRVLHEVRDGPLRRPRAPGGGGVPA